MKKIVCPQCSTGNSFYKKDGVIYCSVCESPIRPGRKSPRNNDNTNNWNIIRKQVYERADYSCERCDSRGVELHAHHKTHKSMGGTDELSNLECLCIHCHTNEHPDNPVLLERCMEHYSEKLMKFGIRYENCNNCSVKLMNRGWAIVELILIVSIFIIGVAVGFYLF